MSTSNRQSARALLDAAIDDRFDGRFEVQQVIRDTATCLIASGVDRATNEKVILQSATCLSRGAMIGLEFEVAALQQIDSEFLTKVVDVEFHDQAAVLIDAYAEGIPLNRIVDGGPLDTQQAIEIAKSMFAGLRDLHNLGVYHLDIRPQKLIVRDDEGSMTLLRRHIAVEHAVEEPEARMRRICYVSPEQAGSIERDVAAPADLYSAGAVLFYALSGRPPFVTSDVSSTLLAHMTAPVPSFRELGVAVPHALENIICRLLSKDPSDRYQTANAVLHDLDQVAASLSRGDLDPQLVIGSQDDRATLTEPSFVGRQEELDTILNQMQGAIDGASRVVFLEGISGSGKSRLLLEVYQRAVARGFQLFRGQGIDGATRGLSLLDGIVEDLVAAARRDDGYLQHFLESFDEDVSCLASVFPSVAELMDADEKTMSVPEDFAEARTLRTLCRFLDSLGSPDCPALIILDDCQWADTQTYKLLERWVSEQNLEGNGRNVLLMLAWRSEEVAEDHVLRRLKATGHIELSELSTTDVQLLAESMAGTLPSPAVDLVINAAHGSPFMASATVRGLVESGAIYRHDSGWEINEQAFAECQSSNHAGTLLARRLELLSPQTLELLTAGAVLGKEFDLDAVNYLTGQDAATAMRWFDEARKRNIVWVRGGASRGHFSHDKIREALLERLPAEQRRAIHQAAADYLSTFQSTEAVQIAFHYDEAGRPELALPFALDAAEESKNKSSLDVAKALFLIAERAVKGTDQATMYRVNRGLGEVLMLQGEYDPAAERFNACEKLATGTIAKAQILLKVAEVARKRGDLENAIAHIEAGLGILGQPVPTKAWVFNLRLLYELFVQALTTCLPSIFLYRKKRDPTEAERLKVLLLSSATHAYWYVRGKSETLWAHFRGLNLGERYNPSLELANAYSEHAPVMSLLGMTNRALRYAQKSFDIRASFGDLWGQGQSLTFHAIALYSGARFEEAITRGRESVRLLERAGDYWCVHMARYQVAASLYRLGRFREALQECEKNYESALAIGDEQSTGNIVDVWAQTTEGQVPPDYLRAEVDRERIDMQTRCEVLMADGINLLRAGEHDKAIAQMQEGVRVTNEAGVSNCYTLPVYYWRTRALRQKAELQNGALSASERSETLGRAFRSGLQALAGSWMCKNDVARVYRELALVRFMQGAPRQARWLLSRSLRLADRLGQRFDYAESLQAIGQIGQTLRLPGADEQAAEAQTLLSQITVESGITDETELSQQRSQTLSLADRFDTILEVGRRIAAALSEEDVYEQTRLAAVRLLRSEDCVLVAKQGDDYVVINGEAETLDTAALNVAIECGRARASELTVNPGTAKQSQGSALCAPIYVLGAVTACVWATHRGVRDLFGATEERLADFIAAIAGASLENAHGYNELQNLNLTLEDRVAERTEAAEARARELAKSNLELERTAEELRSTEDQLRLAIAEANSANEAKSQFLATMSHEIRTPMNGILGMTDLLMRSTLTPQQSNSLSVVKQSGETLLALLNDVLDLSKIEAGKMELEQIEFGLRDVVENATRLLSTAAHKKDLEVVCEVDNDVPHRVVGDPNRLRQILTNLIGNAIKFTQQGEIHVRARREQENVVFSVRDTGIGIPEAKQAKVFEAFRQSDSSTTRQYGGTGLGLSITRTFVNMMGGDMRLDSQPNVGSTFEFDIPFEQADSSRDYQSDVRLRSLVAAVVSANARVSRATASILELFGMSVLRVDHVSELSVDDVQDFDLIILDEPMPDRWTKSGWKTDHVIEMTKGISTESCGIPQLAKPLMLQEVERTILDLMFGPEAAQPQLDSSAQPGLNRRILLADDSIVNQEVASGLLQYAGHTVVVANNGCEAVETFSQEHFDLVLMDLEMPQMDGFESTKQIRQTEKGAGVPIIAMSAHADLDKQRQCEAGGFDEYIPKPFDADQLLECIERLTASVAAAEAKV